MQVHISRALGMSTHTVSRGMKEVQNLKTIDSGRIRQAGGERKQVTELDPELLDDLERLIAPETRGDPESRLL